MPQGVYTLFLREEVLMNYQTGKPGRIIVAKFDDHDGVLEHLADIARKENIRAAVLYLVGGMRQGRWPTLSSPAGRWLSTTGCLSTTGERIR